MNGDRLADFYPSIAKRCPIGHALDVRKFHANRIGLFSQANALHPGNESDKQTHSADDHQPKGSFVSKLCHDWLLLRIRIK